jgi:hypothetical protein
MRAAKASGTLDRFWATWRIWREVSQNLSSRPAQIAAAKAMVRALEGEKASEIGMWARV